MEMEFKDTGRRRRLLLIGLGAALALAAGYGAFQLASNGNQAPPVVKESVLVAARNIQARTPITADDVTTREVAADEILAEAYHNPADVLGRLTAVPIYAGQQISSNLFATATADADFSILGPDETIAPDSTYWRAVAVQVPANRAVGGALKAGDRVDLFVSVQIDILAVDPEGNYQQVETATQDGLQSGTSTKITFQDLQILKADPEEGLYLLKVDLHQAEQIYHVVQVAPDSFSLALRPGEDTRAADTTQYGETTDRLIMTYLFPVPQLIDLSALLGVPVSPGQGGATPSQSPGASPSPGPGETSSPETTPAPDGTPAPPPL